MYVYFKDPRIDAVLGLLERQNSVLNIILRKEELMATKLQDLQAAVAASTAVETSAIALLQGLAAQIAELKNDPAAIQAMTDQLQASAAALAAAITANTPSS